MSIGKNIRNVRELKDINRTYMAKRLGIGVTAYGNLERGTTRISDERKKQIAEILGMTEEELENFNSSEAIHHIHNGERGNVIGNNSNNSINENQAELIELYKQNMQLMQRMADVLEQVVKKIS